MEAPAPQQQHQPPPAGSQLMNPGQDQSSIANANVVPSGAEGQILPLLLTRPPSLTPNSSDPNDQSDHEIIEQVISLEDDYSGTTGIMSGGATCGDVISTGVDSNNQYSSSTEDLYNLFMDYDQTNISPMITTSNQMPDERMRIEKIREQLKSCEVQSESPMCPINTMQPCQTPVSVNQLHHTSSTHISTTQQTAPVTMHHPHHMQPAPPPPPMNSDQQMMQAGYPGMTNMSRGMPVLTGQPYAPSPTQMSQGTTGIVGPMDGTPQQRQTSFSPQSPYCQATPHTSKQYYETISSTPSDVTLAPPPEASPVVRKNPLLNAHLANKTKTPSLSTRYVSVRSPTTNVVHQNPILNAKLSGVFAPNSVSIPAGAPSSNQPRYVQAQTNYNFEPQQQQSQQHQQPQQQQQQPQQMALYGLDSSQVYRNVNAPNTITMANTSNMGSTVSHQVKEGLRRKVSSQQPKQETSLLKQLLSDDK